MSKKPASGKGGRSAKGATKRLPRNASRAGGLADALGASLDGMALLDDNARVTAANDSLAALLGYGAPEELIGKAWRALLAESEQQRVEDQIMPALRRSGRWKGESSGRRRDGTVFPQELSLLSLKSGGVLAVLRDASPRRQAEAEHERLLALEREARSAAEAASRAKDEFLAVVSHELRTPMTAVLGWTWLLRSGEMADDEQLKALDVIERNMRMQAQIIEDLLDVSSIVTGKIKLETRPLDLSDVLRAASENLSSAAAARRVSLELHLEDGISVSGDRQRLHQVFWNLLSNAIKFNREGGQVRVGLERDGDTVVVTVSDDGEGISSEFLPGVFEPFRQGESSLTRRHRGLGLGLAIVRHLIELHGGSVAASSSGLGGGSTFTVALPAAAARPPAGPRPELPGPAVSLPESLRGLRLLLVDDEADMIVVVSELLRHCGAQVRTACSAAEALGMIISSPPDALIADIAMPHEDGLSLIRKVRLLSRESGGRVPALALTARARDDDRDRCLAAGFDAYLAKPVDPPQLVAALRKVLRGTSLL